MRLSFILLLMLFYTQFSVAQIEQNEKELFKTGVEQQLSGDFSKALITFTKLTEINSKKSIYFYYLAISKLQLKNYSDALVDFNRYMAMDSVIAEAYFNRYIANKETKNFQFALADVSRYLTYFPNDTNARLARYSLALNMSENTEILEDGKWLIKNKLADDSTIATQLRILENENRNGESLELLNFILEDPKVSVRFYLDRAFILFSIGLYEKSIADIDRFLISEPKYIPALKLKFDNHFYLRKLPDCENLILELIDLQPDNGTFIGDYGHILLQKGDWKGAEKQFDKAIRFKSENLGYIYLGRAIARYNTGRAGLACSDWERSLLLGESISRKYLNKYCDKIND